MAVTYNTISGAEPSTVTFAVQTVEIDQGGSPVHREILVVGDPESSIGVARVLASAPASTEYGVVVRQVGHSTTVNVSSLAGPVIVRSSAANLLASVYQSTAADFQATVTQASTVWEVQHSGPITVRSSAANALVSVYQSTAADLNVTVAGYVAPSTTITVRQSTAADLQATVTPAAGSAFTMRSSAANALVSVYQSTAADLNVTVAGYVAPSTTIQVSSLAGAVIVRSSAANALVSVYQSTVADLLATVNNRDGAGNNLESSTSAPSTGARGLIVRPVMGGIATVAISTMTSSAATILSSAATTKGHVFAYSITTTIATPVEVGFYRNSTLLWPIVLQAVSSAISGANLAVSPPGFLFAGSTGKALTFNVSSTGSFKVGVAYWIST